MKRFLLVYLIFQVFLAFGQTSLYHPFPDSNAVWNYNFQLNCFSNGTADENYSIIFFGDTIIKGKTYHKLSTPFVQSVTTGNCGGISSGYKGAIRQDIAAKKVFYISPTDSSEKLLYDFTMQVGDTVRGYIESFGTPTSDIVQSIDSVLVGSTYRKRWNINNCYNIHFIEGIGSTYGLFERSPTCLSDMADFSLSCFQQNGKTIYPDTISNCRIYTYVKEIDSFSNQIKVFPNPSAGSFTIDFYKASIKEIKLTDLLGNIVFQRSVNKQTHIKLSNLQKGIYILTAIDKDGKKAYKKIISRP